MPEISLLDASVQAKGKLPHQAGKLSKGDAELDEDRSSFMEVLGEVSNVAETASIEENMQHRSEGEEGAISSKAELNKQKVEGDQFPILLARRHAAPDPQVGDNSAQQEPTIVSHPRPDSAENMPEVIKFTVEDAGRLPTVDVEKPSEVEPIEIQAFRNIRPPSDVASSLPGQIEGVSAQELETRPVLSSHVATRSGLASMEPTKPFALLNEPEGMERKVERPLLQEDVAYGKHDQLQTGNIKRIESGLVGPLNISGTNVREEGARVDAIETALKSRDIAERRDSIELPPLPRTNSTMVPLAPAFHASIAPLIAAHAQQTMDASVTADVDFPGEEVVPIERPATTGQVANHVASRVDLPKHVAAQLAFATRAQPGGPVEIALKPEELGRVKMVISTTESGVSISISAERADTFDLIRRHATMLSRELVSMGFDNVDLSFEQGEASGDGQADNSEEGGAETGSEFGALNGVQPLSSTAGSGLDATKALDKRI